MARVRDVKWLVVILLSISSDQIRAASLTREDRRLYDDLKAGRGLYNSDDKVTVLNATNFKSTVYGTSNAWIIEFYNSWCGFCHRFAPVWKSLALDIYGNFIYLIRWLWFKVNVCFLTRPSSKANTWFSSLFGWHLHHGLIPARPKVPFSPEYPCRLCDPSNLFNGYPG